MRPSLYSFLHSLSNTLFARGDFKSPGSPEPKAWVKPHLFAFTLLLLLGPLGGVSYAAVDVELTPSAASPRPVGTTVTWTATASDTDPGSLDYQFSVLTPTAGFTVVRDFSPSNSFEWTPGEREGDYQIRVTARNTSTLGTAQETAAYSVSSRVVGGAPVVSSTANPLVALYSAPACDAGDVRVKFWPTAAPDEVRATSWKPCQSGVSLNFYVAGMRPSTQYSMRREVRTVGTPPTMNGATLNFTTGALPSGPFASFSVPDAPDGGARGVVLHTFPVLPSILTATDLGGNILWYYNRTVRFLTRPLEGGNMVVLLDTEVPQDTYREIDLAGNTLRETNMNRVSEQLIAAGGQAITSFHHEALRLPDGKTLILCTNERVMTGVQSSGTDYIIGDVIVVLDENLQLVWSWDAFDHMDVTRKAIGDFKCSNSPTCVTSSPGLANDWLHSNSVSYTPADGNLIMSIRHQDWVIKIAYEDGSGTGEVVWRLGKDGDFALTSADPYPWFSYQHDAEFDGGAPNRISIFDNGNARQSFPGALTKNSRGQVFDLDETNLTATVHMNADLGNYSFALGSAQRLAGGGYHFNSGLLPAFVGQSIGVTPAGLVNYRLQASVPAYRTFRMRDLYTLDSSVPGYVKDEQTISFATLAAKTFGDAPFDLSATSTSELPVAFRVISGPATISGNTLTITGAGDVVVEAAQAGDDYYNAATPVERTFTVNKAAATLALSGLSQTYDGTAKGATVTTNPAGLNGVTVSYSQNSVAVASPTNAGEYAVVASLTNDDYQAASVNGTLVIAKAAQTISFAALAAKTFGDAPFALTATSTSNLPVSFQIVSGPASLSGNTLTISGAGTVVVKATQAGDSNFNAASEVERTLVVNKAAATLTLGGLSQTYDGTARSATVTTNPSGLSGVSVSYTLNGEPVAQPTNAGSYQVVASLSNSNYQATDASGTLVIAKATQTITFAALTAKTFGDAPFALTASSTSNLPVSFQVVSGPASLSGSTLTINGAGTVVVKATQAGDANFNAAPEVERSFTVNKAQATLTLGDLNHVYDGTARSATVTTNPAGLQGVAVTYTRNGVPVSAPTSAGSYEVAASLTNANYQAASVNGTLVISKAAQTISFAALAAKTFGDAPFGLSATSTSGLPVSLVLVTGPATLNDGTVTINGAGTVTVRASQPGDANFMAAPDVERSFNVARAATTTAVTSPTGQTAFGQSVTLTANVSSGSGVPTGAVQFKSGDNNIGLPVALNASGSATLNVSDLPVGTNQIVATYLGDTNFAGSFGTLPGGQKVVRHVLQFSLASYSVGEGDGQVSVTVTRVGDLTAAATVEYATSDNTARDRADYNRAAGSLSFAAGEAEKSFSVLINQDSYVEGTETLSITLSGPTNEAVLGQRAVATLEIADDVPESAGNPNDESEEFVRQHYHDFLNREPDAGGLAFWTGGIESCGADQQCRANKRVDTSAAFFLSIEFQETGFLVQRMYKSAYGEADGLALVNGVRTAIKVPVVRMQEFFPDSQKIGQNVIVGTPGWPTRLNNNKDAFALEFVQRARFTAAYPSGMTPTDFVNALIANAGVPKQHDEWQALVNHLTANNNAAGRAFVLRRIAEAAELAAMEKNKAFVLMQYFGYLRRDPNAAPDADHSGYNFWLGKLDQFDGDFRSSQMVFAFLDSFEYRQRFAP